MEFIKKTDLGTLKELVCGCGKPAEIAWCIPPKPKTPKKISKTSILNDNEEINQTPQLYGWSCGIHMPPGISFKEAK